MLKFNCVVVAEQKLFGYFCYSYIVLYLILNDIGDFTGCFILVLVSSRVNSGNGTIGQQFMGS